MNANVWLSGIAVVECRVWRAVVVYCLGRAHAPNDPQPASRRRGPNVNVGNNVVYSHNLGGQCYKRILFQH